MANEECEFSDDTSDHANLPKKLINIPNLSSKDNDNKLNKKNGKLTKSICPTLEKQKPLKNKYNVDLTLSLKVSDNSNKNNKTKKNNNETKFTKLHVTNFNRNKYISPQKKLNNKISLNNSPKSKKSKRNTIVGADALYKKKLIQSTIITPENNVKLENNKNDKNKKIEFKNEKNNVIQKRKSLDGKCSDKKKIKNKKSGNTPGKDKNGQQDNNIKQVYTDKKKNGR